MFRRVIIILCLPLIITTSCTRKDKQDNKEKDKLEYLNKVKNKIEKKKMLSSIV